MLSSETRVEGIAHVDPRIMYDSTRHAWLHRCTLPLDPAPRSFPPTIVNWFVSQVSGTAVLIVPPSPNHCFLHPLVFLFTRSYASACTCSNAALRPLPSNSLHLQLLPLLLPPDPDFPPFYLWFTRLHHQMTRTLIASAATECSTAGSSAASLIICRVCWACRFARFFIVFLTSSYLLFPSHRLQCLVCRPTGKEGYGPHQTCLYWVVSVRRIRAT